MLFSLLTQSAGWPAGLAMIVVVVLGGMALASLAPRLLHPGDGAAWTGSEARRLLANVTSDNTPWGHAILTVRRIRTLIATTIGGASAMIFALLAYAHHFDLSRDLLAMTNQADGLRRQISELTREHEAKIVDQQKDNNKKLDETRHAFDEQAKAQDKQCQREIENIKKMTNLEAYNQVTAMRAEIKERDAKIDEYSRFIEDSHKYNDKFSKYVATLRAQATACGAPPLVWDVDAPREPKPMPPPPGTPTAPPPRR